MVSELTTRQPCEELVLARNLSQAVKDIEGVDSLSSGRDVEIATYSGKEKVLGIKITSEEVEVHLIARQLKEGSVLDVASTVKRVVVQKLPEERAVSIVVDDLILDQDSRKSARI